MALKLVVSATVLIAVAGLLHDEAGVARPFTCSLTCDRLTAEGIRERLEQKSRNTQDFMREVIRGWRDVLGEDGNQVPFSPEACDQLLNIPGLANLAFAAYFEGCGAKAKN